MSKVHQQRSQFIMLFFAFSFGMILSNLLGQSGDEAEQEDGQEDVVMVYRGLDKTMDDLPEPFASQFKTLREETRKQQTQILYSVALEWQLQEFAQKEQLSLMDAGNKMFDLSPPTDEEVNAFYTERADKIAKPFYQVKDQIYKHLAHEQSLSERDKKVAELLKKGDLALFLD